MHYIDELNLEQRISFLSAVSHVAHADEGELHAAEEEFLTTIARLYDIPEERIHEIMDPKEEKEVLDSVRTIEDSVIRLSLLRELFYIAHADGEMSDNEIIAIGKIANELQIPMEKVEKISDWVLRGLEWQEEGEKLFVK